MSNGIAATQEGIDVQQALDAQKVLDSRWRYFDMLFEEIVSLGTLTQGSVYDVFEHNIGFVPAFDCYSLDLEDYMSSSSPSVGGLVSSDEKVYFYGTYDDPGWSSTRVLLRIYNVPILEQYDAPIEKTFSGQGVKQSQYGVQIAANPDADALHLQELSEFTLNTKGKSFAIQKTGYAVANSGTNNQVRIQHDLGFPPTYLSAQAAEDLSFVGALNPSFVPVISKTSSDNNTLIFSGAQSVLAGTYAFVIFKEPTELVL